MTQEIVFPGAPEFKTRAVSLLDTANSILIVDDDGFAEVGEFLITIKKDRKELDRLCDPAIDAAFLEHKARLGFKKELAKPLDAVEVVVKKKMSDYDAERRAQAEIKRKADEAEATRQAEAKRKIELAELAKKQEAERAEREKAEMKRKAEIAELEKKGKAEAAERAREASERQKEIDQKKAKQEEERAKALAAAPLEITEVVKTEAPKAAGVSITQDIKAEVFDLYLLAQSIGFRKTPASFMVGIKEIKEKPGVFESSKISDFAKGSSGEVEIPGVRYYTKDRVTARA